MRSKYQLSVLLEVLLICTFGIHLLNQLQLFSLFVTIFELIYTILISLCFVFIFEPIIEKVPFKKRGIQCTAVYFSLFILVFLIAILFMPVIVNEWEKVKELFQKVISMAPSETELAFSYQNAFDSTLTFLEKFADISLSYLLGYFISLEYLELKNYLSKNIKILHFFILYDDFKEMIFLYIKALALDLGILLTAQTFVLSLFHVRYAFSLAFGLAVLNIIPYFGSMFGQIIIFFIDYLTTGTFRLGMIMSVFVVQQIESNCLQPLLYGKVMHLKPLYIFISILFFGSFMGLIGVLFAPVFAVAIQYFLQHLKQSIMDDFQD